MTENFDEQPLPLVDMCPDGYFEGLIAGSSWVRNADPQELKNYDKFIRSFCLNDELPDYSTFHRSLTGATAERIGSAILKGLDFEPKASTAREFWGSIESSDPQRQHWLEAFCSVVFKFLYEPIVSSQPSVEECRVQYGEPGPNGGVVNEVFFDETE